MPYKLLTLFFTCLLVANASFAKIFRLGFTGPQVSGTDFTSAQAAHDAASDGDTLLIYPGNYSVDATKKLIYIGFGYYISGTGANPDLQLINGSNNFYATLHAEASGSVFEGIDNLNAISYYQENVNDITIKRCTGSAGVYNYTGSVCNNWQILQCDNIAITRNWQGGIATNLRVENCRITQVSLEASTMHTGQFNNCIFLDINVPLSNNAISFQNCIFTNSVSDFTNSVFQYCLFQDVDPGLSGSHNQFSVPFTNGGNNTVFVGYPTQGSQSNDGRYKLAPGSPAIGTGVGGVDLGMYGGANPYKLSGMPPIPAFYKLTAPSNNATSNPYTITFSVRSNN